MAIKVLYITSLSHSGSTLLDLMLNAHSKIFSVGELKQLQSKWRNLKPSLKPKKTPFKCCCGDNLKDCDFWKAVNLKTELTLGKSLADINMKGQTKEDFPRDNEIIFKIISDIAKTPFIVDSSKDVNRLKLLKKVAGIELIPIVLTRDPKGQIYSTKTKATRKGERIESIASSIVRYNETNRKIQEGIKQTNYVSVQYEQLVIDPEKTLRSILGPLGLNFEQNQLNWADHAKHLVAGNRMRWQTNSEIKTDLKWKQNLSLSERICIDVATISSRYPSLGILEMPLTRIAGFLLALKRISGFGPGRRK